MPAFPASSGAGIAGAASAFSPPVQKKIDAPPPDAPANLPRADEGLPSAGVAGASSAPAPKGSAGAQSGGTSSTPSAIIGKGMLGGASALSSPVQKKIDIPPPDAPTILPRADEGSPSAGLAGASSAPAPKGSAGAQSGGTSSPIVGKGMLGGGEGRSSGGARIPTRGRTFYYVEGIDEVDIGQPPSDLRYGWNISRIFKTPAVFIEITEPDLLSPLTPPAPQIVLPTFQISIRSGMRTAAPPQSDGVRGAVHTAVMQIDKVYAADAYKTPYIVISRQSTGYLKVGSRVTFTSALTGGTVQSITLVSDGEYDDEVWDVIDLIADASNTIGGAIAISVNHYKSLAYTMHLTPWRLMVRHVLPGATLNVPVQISVLMPDFAVPDGHYADPDRALLMEARYAAFGWNLDEEYDPHFSEEFFRYGANTPASTLQRAFAAAKADDSHHYVIPPHAVKGYYIYRNKKIMDAGRLLSNKEAGTLAVDFRSTLARLNLKVHGFHNTMSGGSLLTDPRHLGDELVSFSNFALGSWSWDNGGGIGNSGCGLAGGDKADATVCAGGFVLAGVTTLTSQAEAAGITLGVDVRFYGAHAQEIAGFARYTSDEHIVQFGFLGIHARGGAVAPLAAVPAVVSSYAALSWDSADGGGASMTVHVDARGAPVSLSVGGSAVAFGTDEAGYVHRYFRNTLGVALRPKTVGMVLIGDYATLVVSVHSVTVASGAQSSVYAVEGQTYQSADSAVFSYLVRGRDAAFFYILDDRDIRKARHGFYGAPAWLWMMDLMHRAEFHGAYAIPAGGAQGFAWNSSKASDYFLRNSAAGKIGVDFGAGVLTLGITVGATDKDGVYTDDFLRVTDFRMKIRGNVFNNYHCTGASHAAGTACTGVLQFAADGALARPTAAAASPYLAKYDASVTAASELGDVQVHAGGGFYGEGAPRAVAGGIAYYAGDSSEKGMRLQFLGANPWYGKVSANVTSIITIGEFGRGLPPVFNTLAAARRQHYATQADGVVVTLSIGSAGAPSFIVLPSRTITFGTRLLGDQSKRVFPGTGGTLIIATNGISVSAGMLYSAPGDLHLDAVGGSTVAATSAAVNISYDHRIHTAANGGARRINILHRVRPASDESGTPGDMFVHYLGGEYAAFAHYPQERTYSPTVIQGGVRAPASYMSTVSSRITHITDHYGSTITWPIGLSYTIPVGGAFGYMRDVMGGGYHLIRNTVPGKITVLFESARVAISVSLSGMESRPADAYSYKFHYLMAPLHSDNRTFGNQVCRSSGVTVRDRNRNCAGRVVLSEPKLAESEGDEGGITFTITNSTPATDVEKLNVFGGFYGNEAQEIAVAVYHTYAARAGANQSHPRTVAIGILGRQKIWGDHGRNAYIKAEYAAFNFNRNGGVWHYRENILVSPPSASSLSAVYHIAPNMAGGFFSISGVAVHTLYNSTAGQLRVDPYVENRRATLDLTFQDSTGEHRYEIDDLGTPMYGIGFRCVQCSGSIKGSGDLSDFAGTDNLYVDGAFYGPAAEEAAGILRHTSGGGKALNLGFIGVSEKKKE